jgi:hypothetical protein
VSSRDRARQRWPALPPVLAEGGEGLPPREPRGKGVHLSTKLAVWVGGVTLLSPDLLRGWGGPAPGWGAPQRWGIFLCSAHRFKVKHKMDAMGFSLPVGLLGPDWQRKVKTPGVQRHGDSGDVGLEGTMTSPSLRSVWLSPNPTRLLHLCLLQHRLFIWAHGQEKSLASLPPFCLCLLQSPWVLGRTGLRHRPPPNEDKAL